MKFSSEISTLLLAFPLSSSVVNGLAVGNKRQITTTTTLHNAVTQDAERLASLPLPPARKPGPFRGLRESISHLSNNQRFVRKRAAELGDVFFTNVFFQPTVVIGGREAVQEFVSGTELKSKVINSAFPDSFKELHTKWGSLNLDANDASFKEARELFADVFSRDAFVEYTPILNQEMDLYIQDLKARVKSNPEVEIRLVPELKDLSLQMFSKIFSGEGLSEEQVQMFNDYNDALLALPFEKKKLEKGRYALKTLKKEMLARFKKFPEEGDPSNPANYYFRIVQNKEGFEDEDRVCTGMILFIWAAYIECASLMTNSLIAINKYNPDYVDIVLKEVQAQDSKEDISPSDFGFWSGLDNTLGVLRESLRLIPPGGGTPRYSKEDFEFRGFRIPAGTAVMMDPRVGNTDPTLFTAPDEFKPTRWVPEKKSSSSSSGCPFQGTALKLGFGSWFPGGFGAHQCPGIPLAELTSKIFLAKTVQEFDGWSFGGGTKKRTGDVKFVEVPIKIPVDDFGVNFSLRN
jgi:cytochrome P450